MRQPRKSNVESGLRAEKALQLRKLGYQYEEIAKQCGYANKGTAWHTVQKLLASRKVEAVDELRQVEGERLDDLGRTFMLKAMKGDEKAAGVVLRIMERRAKLFGLDEQEQTAVQVNIYQSEEWLQMRNLFLEALAELPDARMRFIRLMEARHVRSA